MFKVGDKVVCIDTKNGANGVLKFGKTYTIGGFDKYGFVLLKELHPHGLGYFASRFELAEEVFNISSATDQQLADEYRKNIKIRGDLLAELNTRGYVLTNALGKVLEYCTNPTISKRITL